MCCRAYRGCSHACVYCFARKTHSYLDLDTGIDFDSQIVVKTNAPELLRRELASARWQGQHIAMGTNVDCYQRAEGRYRLMPGILEALRDRANPFSILTKGSLILRDLELLRQAARVTDVSIALSVGYVALYLTLDRLSFIGALHGIGITPWSPSTGLAMALLIIKGLRYAPLVMAAELLSDATLPIAPISAVPVCLGSLVVTAGYTGAAAVLRHAGLQAGIRRSSDVVKLLIVTIISSGLVAGGFVLMNFIVDMLYAVLDPRIRHGHA